MVLSDGAALIQPTNLSCIKHGHTDLKAQKPGLVSLINKFALPCF